jgi:hypothetical protein
MMLNNGQWLAIAVVATVGVAAYILNEAMRGQVQIGLSEDMGKDKRHGVAWVATTDGGMVARPFLADRPKLLVNPTDSIIRNMFYQVFKMGFNIKRLEVLVGKKTRVYAWDESAHTVRLQTI